MLAIFVCVVVSCISQKQASTAINLPVIIPCFLCNFNLGI